MTQALAVQSAQTLQTMSESPTPSRITLDRDNLQFFASMIETAGLLPAEKEPNGQPMAPLKLKSRVMAKIVGGTYYGFDPISAQENLHIINGRITLSARGLSQLLHRSGKYATRQERLDDNGCKLAVLERQADGKFTLIGHVEFTRAMAAAANLLSNPNYKKYPQDMFFARCITRVVKRFAPEVLDGQAVNYALAKQETAPPPEPETPPAQIPETSSAKVGEVYEDQPYSADAVADAVLSDEIDGEFTPIEAELVDEKKESEDLKDLIERVEALIELKLPDEKLRKSVLKGRQPGLMSADDLNALVKQLQAM